MNFIGAIQHATIGYGMRRKVWPETAMLYLEQNELRWVNDKSSEVKLLGPSPTFDLSSDDIRATDWEVI